MSESPALAAPPADTRTGDIASWQLWFLVVSYYLFSGLMHLKVSLWLVRERTTPYGTFAIADAAPTVVIIAVLLLLMVIVRQVRSGARPLWLACFWLLWAGLVALGDRYLTYGLIEYVHYPQYGILAWLLARTLDPDRSRWCIARVLFWTTLMGAGDELLQYLWTTASYSDYLDFNDILINLLAGAGGILVYYGGAEPPRRGRPRAWPRPEALASIVLALGIAVLFQQGIVNANPSRPVAKGGWEVQPDGTARLYLQRGPAFFGSWQKGKRRGTYFVLPPWAGLGALFLVGVSFSGFGWRGGGETAMDRRRGPL